MTNNRFFGNKRIYTIGKKIAEGGEGAIYSIAGDESSVIKIYFNADSEIERKISFMCSNPPMGSVINDLAWPIDIIRDNVTDKFIGFVMPKLITDCELSALYKYNDPSSGIPPILDYKRRIIVAINLCKVIKAVHEAGYVFGDFNPLNIGVNLTNGHIGFFDADSFHIFDSKTNTQYRCKVGCNGYIAPELLAKCKTKNPWYTYEECPLPTFTVETDRFALAIHIFKLLMNGFTPFNGIKEDERASTASPGVGNLAVERDSYCFKEGNRPLSAATPDINLFPDYLSSLWQKAFIDGKNNPSLRPSAHEWLLALERYDSEVVQCSSNSAHFFWKDKRTKSFVCPYCLADKNQIAQQSQVSFKTPVSIPRYRSAKKNHKNYKPLIRFLIIFGAIVSVIALLILGIHSCSKRSSSSQKYDSNNFVLTIESKQAINTDYYNYYVNCDFVIQNKGKVAANKLYGALVFQDSNNSDLITFNVSFTGDVEPNKASSYSGEFKCTYGNEKNELFYSTPFADLAVKFKWTQIDFSDGVSKTYNVDYSTIKNVGEKGKDTSYDTVGNLKNAQVGSIVKFGRYEMNMDLLNGREYVTWIVLSISDNQALLLSEKILIDMPFSTAEQYTPWKDSLVRSYLNGTFFNGCFNEEEKNIIQSIQSNPTGDEKSKGAEQTTELVTIPTSLEIEGFFPNSGSRNAVWTGNIYSEESDDISSIYIGSSRYYNYWCKNAYLDLNTDQMSQYALEYDGYGSSSFTYVRKYTSSSGVRPMIKVTIN